MAQYNLKLGSYLNLRYSSFRYLLVLFVALIFSASSFCYNDLYTVSGIKVDVQADSAVEAQKEAIQQAHRKAFETLIERLIPENDKEERPAISELTPEQIQSYVDGYEVTEQKQSNVRYIATMTFYFRDNALQKYLNTKTTQAIRSSKPPMLVLPIFTEGDSTFLWDNNPWFTAWTKRDKLSIITPIVVPIGDLQDITAIESNQIAINQFAPLHDLARRYGTAGVILAILKKQHADPFKPMEIEIKIVDLDGQVYEILQKPALTSEGPQDQQFNQAIDLIVKKIEGQARQPAQAVTSSTDHQISVQVPFDSPKTWMNIQQILQSTSAIQSFNLKSLSRNKALINIQFHGSPSVLASALGALGLILEQLNGKTWIIRKTGQEPYTQSSF